MRVRWTVEDGYVGKSRPQYTEIPPHALEGLEPDKRDAEIEAWVEEDFRNRITYAILGEEE
jgi:hypothetical protein